MMNLFMLDSSSNEVIDYIEKLNKNAYDGDVIYHAYWNGELNYKTYISILSCYKFNVKDNKNKKIILWVDNHKHNKYTDKLVGICEVKQWVLEDQIKDTFIEEIYNGKVKNKERLWYTDHPSFYADVVRYVLLYKYGGCWFDLDCYFLRPLDPLFREFPHDVVVYKWNVSNHPNGAIFFCLEPRSDKMEHNIRYIVNRNSGWGFKEAFLTFKDDLIFTVLPASLFDPAWGAHSYHKGQPALFQNIPANKAISFDSYFKYSFCYHWHNRWYEPIPENCPFSQLTKVLEHL